MHVLPHVSGHVGPRVMKFGQIMYADDPKVGFEGQGQRSRSPGQKHDSMSHSSSLQIKLKVKGHVDLGQRSRGSMSRGSRS